MYRIYEKVDSFLCEVEIQDGTERWTESDRSKAVFSVIKAAKILNGVYITSKDIEFLPYRVTHQINYPQQITIEQEKILESIKSGHKVLFDHDDLRVKLGITEEECQMLIAVREGEAKFVFN